MNNHHLLSYQRTTINSDVSTSPPSSSTSCAEDSHNTPFRARTTRRSVSSMAVMASLGTCLFLSMWLVISTKNHFMAGQTMTTTSLLELAAREGMSLSHAEEIPTLQETCEATILLLRHCEKGNLKRHCDYLGLERSVYLATLFGDTPAERWPTPSFIFAENPAGRNSIKKRNYREIETVAPLSRKAKVSIDASFASANGQFIVKYLAYLLHSGQLCGKLAVVAWKHSEIGHLAHKLGCGVAEGCPIDYKGSTYDMVWQLRFVHEPKKHPKSASWQVFGSLQAENFDPLAFSKKMGDYPRGGRIGKSHWWRNATIIREAHVDPDGTDNWDDIKPSFVE